jgi:glutamate dehydrogenase
VSERFRDAVEEHRLRREIIATMLSNSMVNRAGPSFVARVADETGAEAPAIAKAFAAARNSYSMTELNSDIDSLDGKVSGAVQLSLYSKVQDLLLDRVNWYLRNVDLSRGLADVIEHYKTGIRAVGASLDKSLQDGQRTARASRAAELVSAGVPDALAVQIASLPELAAAPDIVIVADATQQPIGAVSQTYFAMGAYFRLHRIMVAAEAIELKDHFDRLALDRALVQIASSERALTAEALATGEAGDEAVRAWTDRRGREVERARATVHDIAGSGLTLSKLAVAVGLLSDLAKD